MQLVKRLSLIHLIHDIQNVLQIAIYPFDLKVGVMHSFLHLNGNFQRVLCCVLIFTTGCMVFNYAAKHLSDFQPFMSGFQA